MSKRIVCLFALVLSLAVNASAALIVYDGFDYPAGSLGTRAGGLGWSAGVAWDGAQSVTSPGLEWPGLPVAGNKVTSTSTASFRLMPAGFSALNRTIWISFLCQNSATPSWCGISPFNGSGSEALFIGKPDGSAYWGLALYNSMNDSGGVTGSKLSTVPVGELAFFVVRIINGAAGSRITAWIDPDLGKEPSAATAFYDSETAGEKTGRVPFDRIRISGAGQALFYDELRIGDTYADVAASVRGMALSPSPTDESTDVPLDSVMSWTAGEFAATHDVYLGTNFDDVNNAGRSHPLGVLVSQGQTATEYAAELEYGRTYYWRVDEVNAAPDNTIVRGKVWSFTAEPYAYPITPVAATASSFQANMPPENTINGSGLSDADEHSTEIKHMWMTTGLVKPDWIQYEFAGVEKLYEMWVWNSNQLIENFLGFGAKDVTVEYSADGQIWTALEDATEFAKATCSAAYTHNTTVDFGGALAKYVKLTINSNWGGAVPQTGLSEVRFFTVPVKAFEPVPAVAATTVSVNTELQWRPGREATSHKVTIGVDSTAVTEDAVAAATATDHSYAPASLDFATTYYWKVDEVGGAGTYAGDVWSFTTEEYAVIDDFESYNDDDNRIYDVWIDGVTTQASGSQVGYDESPFAEKSIVHGGLQSMPMMYDNTASPYYSEAEFAFQTPKNLTAGGARNLSLYYRGVSPSFKQTASGGILMNGIGSDIWGSSDAFRFVYKTLTGNGTIVARIDSLYNSNSWAKGGVMIRQNTDPGATNVLMAKTAVDGSGATFQWRLTAGATSANVDASTVNTTVTCPYWLKVQRSGDSFTAYISPDGAAWTQMGTAQTITMTGSVMIGLALTSHDAAVTTGAEFSNVAIIGNTTGDWQIAEIGTVQQEGNSAEPIYVTVKDNSGKSKTVVSSDAVASARMGWNHWTIPLSDLTSAGVKMTAVKSIVIGVGNKAAPTAGGTGILYIDDLGFGTPLP
jgi:hypothetical protein